MPRPTLQRLGGFTLAEMSIVLVILALLTTGAITALSVQAQRARYAEAKQQIADAREALLNQAAISLDKKLLCPDLDTGAGFDGMPDACLGSEVSRGQLPWKELALPEHDPWGQPLRYAVHNNFAKDGITLTSQSALCILRKSGATVEYLSNGTSVAFAIWSVGPDGMDSSFDSSLTSPEKKVVAEAPNSDDLVIWVSRFILIGRMVEAGQNLNRSAGAPPSDPCT